MALSDDERKMLEQLEAQLANEDPAFVQALAPEVAESESVGFSVSPRHLVLGLIIAVLGIIVVLAGVTLEMVPIGIVGAIVVFAGFWYLAAGAGLGKQPAEAAGKAAKPVAPKQLKKSDFMERQAQAWQKRRDERGM